MKKDFLGKKELEFLNFDWKFYAPGLMNGRCRATGTCDNRPCIQHLKKREIAAIFKPTQSLNSISIFDVSSKYGSLRP
ncbi:hypothetical protein [Candidatus Protochlamydia sp. R18]|uniref:hypothetical protein n=1 Tax=Candidatus Protochlamydia sp. R18 TaxID=1353977 RepID=UPI0005A65801|nr:hypothetical protein [Candidatus Protochlamydia sp. R18]